MRLAARLLPAALILCLFAACEKSPPPPPPAPPPPAPEVIPPPAPPPPQVEVTQGIFDWTRWSKWIQSPPRILLVSSLDTTTQQLIATQTRIFSTLVSPPPDPAPIATGDIQARLDAIKNAFPAKRQLHPIELRNPIEQPHHDRWDSYRRTVLHATLTNLPAIIVQLERKIATDLRDLDAQLSSQGVMGAQARADTDWLRGRMTQQVERLKTIGSSTFVSPESPAAKAREEWAAFETTDLPVLKKVIDANTLADVAVNETGTFSVQGKGQLVASVTIAGRQLYFTQQSPGELRFLNIKKSVHP